MDAGKEGRRKGGMNEIRDGGKEGFRTKMTQERRETGKEGNRKGGFRTEVTVC